MKKTLLISILMILALSLVSATTNSVGDLNITAYNASLTGNESSSVTGSFTVTNIGSNYFPALTYVKGDLVGSAQNISAAQISFNPSTLSLNTSETKTVNFTINIPDNQYADSYSTVLGLNNGTNHSDNFTFTLTVNEAKSLYMPTSPSISVVQGQSATSSFVIANNGNKEISSYTLEVVDDLTGTTENLSKSLFTFSKESNTIGFENSTTANITVSNVPGNQTAGTYNGLIKITYDGKEYNKSFSVTVNAKSPNLVLSAPSMTWVRTFDTTSKQVTFTLKNTGNYPLSNFDFSSTNLTGAGTIDSSKVSFSPDPLLSTLQPNEERNITLTLSALPNDQAVGSYSGTIKAEQADKNITSTFSLEVRDPKKELTLPATFDFGSSSQERNTTLKQSFTVKNTGDYSLSNVNVTLEGFSSSLDANLSASEDTGYARSLIMSFAPGEEKTVWLQLFVPLSQDSQILDIGDIKFTADNYTTSLTNVRLTTRSYLSIKDSDYYINGDKEGSLSSSGSTTIDEVRPGSEIKIQVEVENLFDDSKDETDIEIQDIKMTVKSLEELDDKDIDEESDEIDLDADTSSDIEDLEVQFDIPEETKTGKNYQFELIIEGTDEHGADHRVTRTFDIKVEKEDHDIVILRANLDTDTLSCTRSTSLAVRIANYGDEDEDHVRLKVESSALGVSYDRRDIELIDEIGDDEGEYYESFNIVVPQDKPAGSYQILITTYYDDDEKSNDEVVTLTLQDCGLSSGSTSSSSSADDDDDSGSSSTGSASDNIVINTPSSTQPSVGSTTTTTTSQPPIQVSESKLRFTNSPWYIGLLGVAVVVMLFLFASLLGIALKKPMY